MKQAWWKEAVAYQIYPKSFKDSNGDGIGDLQGIISKLDYLKELGIDVIWICPIYPSPLDDNGYDISDYQNIHEFFGTMGDFDELLQKCHQRNIKLILDLVLNHTSETHPWFIESRSSLTNEKRNWYIWRDGKDGQEPNNWESIFNGSAWEYDAPTTQYYLHLFSKRMPDLNWENQTVRNQLYEMIRWWLDKGIDGFRIDAISHIKKKPGLPDLPNPNHLPYVASFPYQMNQPGILDWLHEMKREAFHSYDIMTVGEANGVSASEATQWVGEENGVFNMLFQFESSALWDHGENETINLPKLKQILTKWQNELEEKGWNALFVENHDKARIVSLLGDPIHYFMESATAIGMMYFFMKGTPFIYQGQEIGMSNIALSHIEDYDDVAIKNYYETQLQNGQLKEETMEHIWDFGRDNARTPMQWDDTKNAGFTATEATPWLPINYNYRFVNVAAQQKDPSSILSFYKKMIALRKQHKGLQYGTYRLLLPEHEQLYIYERIWNDERYTILINLSREVAALPVTASLTKQTLLLHNYSNAHETLTALQPFEARLYYEQYSSKTF